MVKTEKGSDHSRETQPILGNMYQYHIFPMFFIFILISFAALIDDMTLKVFGKIREGRRYFLVVLH